MPANRQPELYAAAIIPYTAAAIALVFRMVARRTMRMRLVWEDYLAIVAFVIGSGFTFITLFKMRWGFGKHVADLEAPLDVIQYHYSFDLWVDMWFYTFSVGLSKFVILGFYWRMFSRSLVRQPIRILFGCSAAWIIVRVILICLQCIPIQKFWDSSIPGRCLLTPMIALFAAGIPHLVIELAILFCPLVEIWRLHLSTAKKMAVAVMFTSGVLVCCSALGTVIHTVMLEKVAADDQDLTFDGIDDQIWAVCDVNLASFSTSLPLLRPVFRKFGGIFSGLATSIGLSTAGDVNPNSATVTFGSGPGRRPRPREEDESDLVEFANEGSNKAYALHDISSRGSDVETEDCIHVQTETTLEYGKA